MNQMSGPEHYKAAQNLISAVLERRSPRDEGPLLLAAAQVHATLALAAATALRPYERADDPDQESGDWEAWLAVADTKE